VIAHDRVEAVLARGVPLLRELPWRRTRDPWSVLVSEVMLQQTQIASVIPKWIAFLEQFPTVADWRSLISAMCFAYGRG